ncbi:unnamed protein product, partial [Vitis vinifera]|uniref:Uncharacterized protein n=1 Tax=Vitis vinifera TaxID=29760 RepID=D7SWY4_VITVI
MSKRGGVGNNQAITDRLLTCRQRLYSSLNFGFSSYDDKERKWRCPDIEMQKHVLHSIGAFLGFISADTCQHPLVKMPVSLSKLLYIFYFSQVFFVCIVIIWNGQAPFSL